MPKNKVRRDLNAPGYRYPIVVDPTLTEKNAMQRWFGQAATEQLLAADAPFTALQRHALEVGVLADVGGLPPERHDHLARSIEILTDAGCSDEDKIDLLTRILCAENSTQVADAVSIAWMKTDEKKRRSADLDSFIGPEALTRTQALIVEECDRLKSMLLDKNRRYGDSAINPVRVFSRADPIEQIKVRIDDKLSRAARGDASTEDEDVVTDLAGYLVLLKVAERIKAGG